MHNPYKDDLATLQDEISKGVNFTTSHVMRKMRWGYNRTRNTIDLAVANGEAEEVGKDDLYAEYRFV